jgi:hypothetical protein
MTNAKDQIAQIIADAERNAYARGVNDTITAFATVFQAKSEELLKVPAVPVPDPAPPKAPAKGASATSTENRGRPSKAVTVVDNAIAATPGMTGVEVVKAVHAVDAAIPERTVRTCLRRLRLNKKIWRRGGRWYPKTIKETGETRSGEAVGTPPH